MIPPLSAVKPMLDILSNALIKYLNFVEKYFKILETY